MKKKIYILIYGIIISFFLMQFSSCASTINVNITRPANLDLNGAKTIAVLPIKPYAYYREYDVNFGVELIINTFYQLFEITDPDEQAVIRTLRSSIESGLSTSPYIKLIDSAEVERALNKGYLNPADVYLTGEVAYFNVDDRSYEERKKIVPATGNQPAVYQVTHYWIRDVDFIFRYQIVDSSTNRVISHSEVRINESSSSYERRRALPSPYDLIEYKIRYAAKSILKELQPYTVTKSIQLLDTKTKDKALKEVFKAADELARNNLLKESCDAFGKIYRDTNMVEAGYNAAIIQEALGNLSLAERMMTEVYEKNPDSRVAKGLADIQNEIQLAKRLNKQIEKKSDEDSAFDFDSDSDDDLDLDF